jgi:hypothetical protein
VKGWKTHIAIFLLAILAVTVVPKQLMHDCAHAHGSGIDHHEQEISSDTDCPLCDYNFSASSPSFDVASIEEFSSQIVFLEFGSADFKAISPGQSSSRGPPHC